MLPERLKKRRKERKISQEYIAKKLGMTRQGYGHYETGRNEPDNTTLVKLAEVLDCSSDYLLGRTDDPNSSSTVNVAGQDIPLSPEENKVFEEIKKHPIMFNDLASDPERKIKKLIKMWEFIKEDLEEDDEEPEDIIKDDD